MYESTFKKYLESTEGRLEVTRGSGVGRMEEGGHCFLSTGFLTELMKMGTRIIVRVFAPLNRTKWQTLLLLFLSVKNISSFSGSWN